MTAENSTEETEAAVLEEAEKVNYERMAAVKELAAAVAHRVALEEQIKEAEKREKQLARDAAKAGWTEAQIKRFTRTAKSPQRSRGGSPAPVSGRAEGAGESEGTESQDHGTH